MRSTNFGINPMLLVLIFVLAIVVFTQRGSKEGYSQAALIQLYAKGPQDTYLTGDAWKYIPPIYYNYNWYVNKQKLRNSN